MSSLFPPATTPRPAVAMSDAEFDFLRNFLLTRSGLALTREKRYLVESRLTPICRQRNLADLGTLVRELRTGTARDLERLVIEAMATNETLFFRDRTPFDTFRNALLPMLLPVRARARKLRIWCAAASSGQEPYSLAMVLDEMAAEFAGWRIEIVATDICEDIVARAKRGLYSQFEVQRGLPINLLLKHFTQVGDQWQLSSKIRSMVEFRTLNLIKDFSSLGEFDIIYCRNVLIYFDPRTKTDVLNRLARQLAEPHGVLVLGASETVLGLDTGLAPHSNLRGCYARRPTAALASPALPLRRA